MDEKPTTPALAAPVAATAATTAEPAPAPAKPEPRRIPRKPAATAAAPVSAPPAIDADKPEKGARLLSRMRAQLERDRAAVEEAKGYKAELAEYAKGALDGLTKEQRAYVEKHAGDNPAKLLSTVRELRAAGLLVAPASAPANTAPKAQAAPSTKPGDDEAVLTEYERLRKVAPAIALDYATRNSDALKRARARN